MADDVSDYSAIGAGRGSAMRSKPVAVVSIAGIPLPAQSAAPGRAGPDHLGIKQLLAIYFPRRNSKFRRKKLDLFLARQPIGLIDTCRKIKPQNFPFIPTTETKSIYTTVKT